MRVEMHVAERGRSGDKFAVDARLVEVRQRVRHLDDDHSVEQSFVLLLLQELVKLRQVRVRDDGLVEIDQWEARHLDVLFLRQQREFLYLLLTLKRATLTFFSCVSVNSRYRNSRLTFRISIISSMPRLAAYTAPDHDQARGS